MQQNQSQPHTEQTVQQPVPAAAASGVQNKPLDTQVHGKVISMLGYVVPILFFVPYLVGKMRGNEFARFHGNQQFVVLLVFFVAYLIGSFVPFLGIAVLVLWFVMMVIGLRHVLRGEMTPMPIIGGVNILK